MVTDTLGPGLTPRATEGCTISGSTVTCAVGPVAAGGAGTITITADVDAAAAAGTVLTDVATISSTATDPDPSNNRAEASTTVQPPLGGEVTNDVAVTVTADQSQVTAGARVSFTVRVTNNGPEIAPDVVLANVLPRELASVTPSGPGNALVVATPTPPPGCTGRGLNASCPLGALAVGQLVTLQFSGTVAAGTPAGTQLVDTATVTTSGVDAVVANNVDSDVIIVVARVAPTTITPASSGGGGSLPSTGLAVGGLLVLAAGFVVFGGGLRTAGGGRRRRR